jgi:ADP-ribosylglycohydrolase
MTVDESQFRTHARSSRPSRRQFLAASSLAASGFHAAHALPSLTDEPAPVGDDVLGLVIGGVLGDALGGPVEFQSGPLVDDVMLGTRRWPPDRRLTNDDLVEWSHSLTLHSYDKLRPGAEPYGQWQSNAPAGTVTDDTRHKIILMRTLRVAAVEKRRPTANDLAQQFLDFVPHPGRATSPELAALNDEGFREYRYAARWLLGERDLRVARPLERLWAGVPNCSGQMLLTPLAGAFPGNPEAAYRAAFELDFIDGPGARDMAAALVAGLAAVLGPEAQSLSAPDQWSLLLQTMRATDPFGYAEVPFAGRPLHIWMDAAETFAREADGRPSALFARLETDGRPTYYWDAHYTLLVPLAILHFCRFQPLAALNLTLDFGHDTDSYAHVLAAMAGAVHGASLFPESMRTTVTSRLAEDYGEDLNTWPDTLRALQRVP